MREYGLLGQSQSRIVTLRGLMAIVLTDHRAYGCSGTHWQRRLCKSHKFDPLTGSNWRSVTTQSIKQTEVFLIPFPCSKKN